MAFESFIRGDKINQSSYQLQDYAEGFVSCSRHCTTFALLPPAVGMDINLKKKTQKAKKNQITVKIKSISHIY